MKKLLFLLALFATTVASAQNTFTKASWVQWNLDTTKFSGTTSGGVAYGESKTLNTAANQIVVLEVMVATKHDTLASAGITLWGSMDNVTWTRVNMNAGTSPSPIYITKTPVYSYSGTWPSITQPALSVSSLGTAAAWTAADTIAVGTSVVASKAVSYLITLYNPVYVYYKLGFTAAKSADTDAHVTTFFSRYWVRRAY